MTGMGLIQRSLYGGAVILAVLGVRAALLYRLPKRTFTVLWGIALVRLLLPFSFSSVFSVYSLLPLKAETGISEQLTGTIGEGYTDAASAGWAAVQGMDSGEPESWESVQGTDSGSAAVPETVRRTASSEPALSAAAGGGFPVLPMVWGIGTALCAAYFIRAYYRCLRDFQCAVPIENDNRICQWMARHRTGQLFSVRQSDQISAPLTYGVLRPVILLPKRLVQEGCQELEYVLQHEYVHIRHYDAALKLAMITALCIHWFNPLVWLMCGLLNRDIELACDEGVLRHFGEQSRTGYAMALIGMEERKRSLLPLYNGFSKNATEERIVLIMKYKEITYVTGAAALLLILGVTLVFATSPREAEASEGSGILSANGSAPLQENVPLDPPQERYGITDSGNIPENASSNGSISESAGSNGIIPENATSNGNLPENVGSNSSFPENAGSDGSLPENAPSRNLPSSSSSVPGQHGAGDTGSPYTLSYMQEGMMEEEPAQLYKGDGYGILIPTEGWRFYAPDAWMWEANEQVQLWISNCSGSTWNQTVSQLEKDGYSLTQEEGTLPKESILTKEGTLTKESDGRLFVAKLRKTDFSLMCIHYTYPADSEYIEGFHTLMESICASFSPTPAEELTGLSQDGKQLWMLAHAFWEAYLGGNAETIGQYLSTDYTQKIDVFPDGIDGNVAAEAFLRNIKGLPDGTPEETCEISLEFSPAAGADFLEYLTLTAVREGEGWKVLSYGLEM